MVGAVESSTLELVARLPHEVDVTPTPSSLAPAPPRACVATRKLVHAHDRADVTLLREVQAITFDLVGRLVDHCVINHLQHSKVVVTLRSLQ